MSFKRLPEPVVSAATRPASVCGVVVSDAVVCGSVAPSAEELEHPVSAAADNKSDGHKMIEFLHGWFLLVCS